MKEQFCHQCYLRNTNFFDIIFIQELSWPFICSIPSSKSKKGENLVRVPNHPNWIIFSRNSSNITDSPRVITYINVRLSLFCFSLWKDIFNYRNISCISFFNCSLVYFLINIYSNSSQAALKYFKDTEVNIGNVLIMTGDFNIKDNSWDLNLLYHSIHSNTLMDIADSLHLELFRPTNQVPTRYSDNQ